MNRLGERLDRDDAFGRIVVDDVAIEERHAGVDLRRLLWLFVDDAVEVGQIVLTWTADNLLRHTVYVGLREDKPADQVRRETTR